MAVLTQKRKKLPCLASAYGYFLLFRGQGNGRVPHNAFLTVVGARCFPPPIRAQTPRSCRPSTSRYLST